MTRFSLDLDDTVNFWYSPYLDRFGIPKDDYEITRNVFQTLRKDKDFWLTLPIKHRPNFNVWCYTTARVIQKDWIKEYIQIMNLPDAPVYQVFGCHLSKVPQLRKSKCDCHVDDSLKHFIEANLAGIPTLLMDSPSNQSFGPIGRVYSLDKDELEDTYHLFKETIFPYFKELVA